MLSESEISRLIQATLNIREKAMICLLAYAGMRNNELCNLRLKDVDLGANHLTILGGKNKKDRVVNIAAECTRVLIDYLTAYRKEPGDFLFSTLAKHHPLATGDLRKTLRVVARRARIG